MTLPYIVNVALILGACLAFYKILLRRETFYKINRYLLIVCLAIAFALPLLQVPQQFSLRKADKETGQLAQQPVVNIEDQYVPDSLVRKPISQTPAAENNSSQSAGSSFSAGQMMNWLFWLYWFGVIIFAGSFLFQVIVLLWRAYRNPVIIDGKYRIVEVSGDKAPCSFGNNIFINPEKYEWETYNQILEHEKVHIRQRHTLDIVFAELVLIFQWFNPFAWAYRREIESNLEFLTDDQLIQQKIDKQSYQLSLVKVSAPHFPLSLTTNYNQSILKKRIAMMNSKRSNLHTAWKYFFLLPVLALLACLLNEPVAFSQKSPEVGKSVKSERPEKKHGMETEGYWFAVIKEDKVNIRFSSDKMDDENFESGGSFNSTTFKLSELGTLPKGSSGTFAISREAGKMEMTGKFDGNTGMGTYKFIADKAYVDYMNKELDEKLDDNDEMAFFFINIKKDYLQMLKAEGFTGIEKDELIPMAAMKIDAAYIKSIKDAGFKDVSMEKLIPLKALNVDGAYIKEIREAGYKDITADQLVTFKSQGINKDYITKVRQLKGDKGGDDDADDIVTFKAMNIDEAFINSFKAIGYTSIPHDQLVSFKATGVTAEYIKGWQNLGFKDIDPDEFVGMKTQNVTPEFMKSFIDMGYKNVKPEELVAFKALGITTDYVKTFEAVGYKNIELEQLPALKSLNITPEYIKSFEAAGYKNIDIDELPALKAQNITPDYIKSFEAVGFKDIPLDEIISVKAMGVTPEYIKDMKSKGFNYSKLQKYITLKSID
ncbi:MAG TPA: M56 family metallopeptidase [Chitinophagaceae bacterium]|nr:M56 family metallopeptidase [Chitinophagaceae bacterium]